MLARFSEILRYRSLLFNLTRKELKVKYRGSVLGFFWSLLNPVLMTLVYSFVFSVVLRAGIKEFAVFLIVALLPWNMLANSINMSVGSIVSNGALIKKIYFPREVLPLSSVFSNLINFGLELLVLFAFLAAMGYRFYLYLYLLPLVVLLELLLAVGASLLVASLNVMFRDVQHLITIFMMVWFFGTPIVYPLEMVPQSLRLVLLANPMTTIISLYRAIFYEVKHGPMSFPSATQLGLALGIVVFVFFLGFAVFGRLEPRFAEEV